MATEQEQQQAVEFFRQLEVFSTRYIAQNIPKANALSPWGLQRLDTIKGAVIHYTADESLDRVIRWFNDPDLEARASSHVVVADRALGSQATLTGDLPLISTLPATVIQCRLPTSVAWHATWTNDSYYGVECVGAGELKSLDGEHFYSWRPKDAQSPDWTSIWYSSYKAPQRAWGRYWDPLTPAQVSAVVAVLRYVRDLPGSDFRRPKILGHENVQGAATRRSNGSPMQTDKRDPGPTCPIHDLRAAVFEDWRPLEQYNWYNALRNDLRATATARDLMVRHVVAAVSGMAELPPSDVAWDRFRSAIHTLPVRDDPFGPWGRLGLWLLGYYVSALEETGPLLPSLSGSLDSDEIQSVWLFQRMAGIETDGKPGSDTRWALLERLKDRGILA